jgi:hypothetical protein
MGKAQLRLIGSILCFAFATSLSADSGCPKDNIKKETAPNATVNAAAAPLQFLDGEKVDTSLTWAQVSSGSARISIWNNSSFSQDVEVTGRQLTLSNSWQGNSNPSEIQYEISPATATIDPGHTQVFTLVLKDHTVTPAESGTYVGIVTVTNTKPAAAPIYRPFRITVQSPKLALTKVNSIAWRIVPFAPLWLTQLQIPFDGSYESSVCTKEKVIGFLHREPTGWAAVRCTAIESSLIPGVSTVADLKIDGLSSAGKYDGEINLSDIQGKPVQSPLSVTAKDIIFWPSLMILFSIYIAWQAKRYIGVVRLVWNLRMQEAELGEPLEANNVAFAKVSQGRSFSSYSIDEDINKQRGNIRNSLDVLAALQVTSLTGNQTYVDIRTVLQVLGEQIAQWPDVASFALKLEEAITIASSNISRRSTVPPWQYSGGPTIFGDVRSLLAGRPIAGAEIASLMKALHDAYVLLRAWNEAHTNTIVVSEEYAKLSIAEGLPAGQRSELDAIRDSLIAVWTHLWQGKSENDFAIGNGTDLDSARQAIIRYKAKYNPAERFGTELKEGGEAISPFERFTPISAIDELLLPEDDARRVQMLQAATHFWDGASVVLAIVIALITGLSTNYWGKPFGTVQDYAVLFLWGAGTKIGVDIVAAITDKFVSSV